MLQKTKYKTCLNAYMIVISFVACRSVCFVPPRPRLYGSVARWFAFIYVVVWTELYL